MSDKEILTLGVTRWSSSDHAGGSMAYELTGDAAFLWEELGMLLVDPLLVSLSLQRTPTAVRPEKQVTF